MILLDSAGFVNTPFPAGYAAQIQTAESIDASLSNSCYLEYINTLFLQYFMQMTIANFVC